MGDKFELTGIVNKCLFWIHFIIMFSGIFVAYYFSWWLLAIGAVLHRMHLRYFGDCILTILQRRLGGHPKNLTYTQFAIQRFFGKLVSRRFSDYISYGFVTISLVVAFF